MFRMGFKNNKQRMAVMAKFKLTRVHQPTRFEKNIFAVTFVKKNAPLVDRNIRFTQVIAKNKVQAVKIARTKLF